jgi:peptidase E
VAGAAAGHIVAMGGGGFSSEPDNPRLDDYVLGLTGKRRPRVCFLPTASGDSDQYIVRFYTAFGGQRAEAAHLGLQRPMADVRAFLLGHDVIYVGGGSTANLLAVWRVHGVDRVLREAWERGTVLAGVSAGMLCWFEGGVTDSFGPLAALRDGLGLLRGTACPHYDGEPGRRPAYHRLLGEGMAGGYAADDGAALHFVGERLQACVASRPGASVYRVGLEEGRVVETPLPTALLPREGGT